MLPCSRDDTGSVGCPGRCACIDVAGDAEPHRYVCEAPAAQASDFNVRRLSWDTRVDFCASNLPLTTLAAFLERAFPDQVLVPGARVHATVSAELDGATLAEVARASGLLVADRR